MKSILSRAAGRAPSMRTSGRSDLVDLDAVELKRETEKAYGLSQGEIDPKTDREIIIWVPKSQVEKNHDGTFTMPEWLAKDKGLI